jgi:outer membrane protein OmpA-like peptidoglycan-associated protein
VFTPRASKAKPGPAPHSPAASRRSAAIRSESDTQGYEDATGEAPSWDLSKVSLSPSRPLEPFRRGPTPGAPRPIQAQLKVGAVDDPLEAQADRVADQMMQTPAPAGSVTPTPHQIIRTRNVSEQEGALQRVPSGSHGTAEAPGIVHDVLQSPGRPLDAAFRTHFELRFGHDFSRVRVHTDGYAAQSAETIRARAYTAGSDVVFASGEFAPATSAGQRLLAHELTHVIQQSGAGRGRQGPQHVVQRQPYYEKSESDVVDSVIDALTQPSHIAGVNVDPAFALLNPHPLPFQLRVLSELFDRGYLTAFLGYLAPGTKAEHQLIVAIRFTECQKDPSLLRYEEVLEAEQFLKNDVTLPPELDPMFKCLERERVRLEKEIDEERSRRQEAEIEEKRQHKAEKERQGAEEEDKRFTAAFEPGSQICYLKKGMMQWHLYPPTSAENSGKKQRIQIKFTPYSPYRNKLVTFLQTIHEEGGSGQSTTIDIGMNEEHFRPFYGINWDQPEKKWVPSKEGQDVGFRSQPSSGADPSAYLFDEPYFFPPPHGRTFESVAVVPETGEVMAALRWGVGTVPASAQHPTCAETPSAEYLGSAEKFYAPQNPASGRGQQNYDVILDGFAPNDAALTADQKKQLDALVARAKDLMATKWKEDTKSGRPLVVGGFGDSADKDPMTASEQRAQAVANYFTNNGVSKAMVDVRTFGVTWARYEVSTKKAKEGGNRRVQIRLFQ